MGVKHYKTAEYTIEQYNEETAVILLTKPFDKEFDANAFKCQISAVLKPILANSDDIDTNHLIFIESTKNILEDREYKHNKTRIEIYLKFLKKLKFKEKVHIIENLIIPDLLNVKNDRQN